MQTLLVWLQNRNVNKLNFEFHRGDKRTMYTHFFFFIFWFSSHHPPSRLQLKDKIWTASFFCLYIFSVVCRYTKWDKQRKIKKKLKQLKLSIETKWIRDLGRSKFVVCLWRKTFFFASFFFFFTVYSNYYINILAGKYVYNIKKVLVCLWLV